MQNKAFSIVRIMITGHFYFLKDEYYAKFPTEQLLVNKGKNHKRPCFYAFKDSCTGLYWFVPLSSQVEKYKNIYKKKTAGNRRCDTIVFGDFLSKENVFLIQNICPVSEKYVDSEYIITADKIPAEISPLLENEIVTKARRVIALFKKGIKLTFTNITEMEKCLLNDLAKS